MNYEEEFDTSLESFRDNVPRQDCNKISKSEFVERFEKPRIPVVLTHAMDHWKGMRKWTVEVIVIIIILMMMMINYDNNKNNNVSIGWSFK